MKKIISKLMALVIVLGVLAGNTIVFANETGEISASTVSGEPGDEVEVTINMDKNPGIISIYLQIGYDENALKLNSVTDEKLLTDYMAGDLAQNPFSVSWEMATAPDNVTSTGTLMTLNFTILDDAQNGDYDITVQALGEGNIIDHDFNDVPFHFTNGSVTVKNGAHEHVYNGRQEVIKEANCTEDGTLRIYCSVEGCTSYEEKTIAAKGHSYGEWETVKKPEIGVEGEEQRICTECGDVEKRNIPAIVHGEEDHVYDGRTEVIKEASCTEEGTLRKYCSFEGCDAYIEESIQKTPHTEGEWEVTEKATCTEDGKQVKKCTVCGTVLVEETIQAEGHSYGEWETVKKPGIGVEGEEQRTCTQCGDVEKRNIPAIVHGEKDHVYDGRTEVIKEASCTEEGTLRKYCSFEGCDAYIEEPIQKTPHIEGEWEVTEKATCTEDGKQVKNCTVCGTVLAEETIQATGHNYGEWKIVKEPEIGAEGKEQRSCTECGDVESRTIPAIIHGENDHVYNGQQQVMKEASCSEEGVLRTYCSVKGCHAYIETAIGKTDHTFGQWEIEKEATATVEGIKKRVCSVCGYVEKADIPVLSEEKGNTDTENGKNTTNTDAAKNQTVEAESVKTGDSSQLVFWSVLVGTAAIVIAGTVKRLQKSKR